MPDWERSSYQPGGYEALLWYVVYGEFTANLQDDRIKHLTAGLPDGVVLQAFDRESHPEQLDAWFSGPIGALLTEQQPAELVVAARAATQCRVVHGSVASTLSLNYLRDTVGVVTALLEQGGLIVLDPQRITWYDSETWRARIFETGPEGLQNHVMSLVSYENEDDDGGQVWLHTRGLRKFGRPDLGLHRVPQDHLDAAVELLERLIQQQIDGVVLPDRGRLRMRGVDELLSYQLMGDFEDLDFNNRHIELVWPK